MTAGVLLQMLEAVTKRLERFGTKGRKSSAADAMPTRKEAAMKWRTRYEKLAESERCAAALLSHLESIAQAPDAEAASSSAASAAAIPLVDAERPTPKRRRRAKTSVGEDDQPANPFRHLQGRVAAEVRYEYKLQGVRTRRYAREPFAVQRLSQWMQSAALPHTLDLDIENCCFVLILQMLTKLEPVHDAWPAVQETLRLCAKEHSTVVSNRLKMSLAEGKQLTQKIFNGGAIPPEHARNQFLIDLQTASIFCRWTAASLFPEAYTQILEYKERPDVSILTYFWNVAEDIVLDSWLRKLQPLNPKHLSLHFDGVRVDAGIAGNNLQAFCNECGSHIERETDFKVFIRPKSHLCFLKMLHAKTDSEKVDCAPELQAPGNCILQALHHLGFGRQALEMQSNGDSPHEEYFRRKKHRTYAQVAEACGVPLKPRLELSELSSGMRFLIHCVPDGKPHCLAVEILEAGLIRITDNMRRWSISPAEFHDDLQPGHGLEVYSVFFI